MKVGTSGSGRTSVTPNNPANQDHKGVIRILRRSVPAPLQGRHERKEAPGADAPATMHLQGLPSPEQVPRALASRASALEISEICKKYSAKVAAAGSQPEVVRAQAEIVQ